MKNNFSKININNSNFPLVNNLGFDKWVCDLTNVNIPDTVKHTIAIPVIQIL